MTVRAAALVPMLIVEDPLRVISVPSRIMRPLDDAPMLMSPVPDRRVREEAPVVDPRVTV